MTQTETRRRTRSRAWVWAAILVLLLPGAGAVSYLVYAHRREQNTKMLLTRACDAEAEGDLAASAVAYRQYLQRKHDDTDALRAFADVMWRRAEAKPEALGETVRVLQRLLARDPEDTHTYQRLIELYLGLKEAERAEQLAARWLQRRPTGAEPAIALSRAKVARGDTEQALDILETAIDHNPDNPLLYAPAVQLLLQQNRQNEAERVLAQGLESCPPHPRLHLAAFYLDAARDKHDEAKEKLQRALDLGPDSLDILLPAAVYHMTQGRFDRAHELLERAHEAAPDDRRVALARAELTEQTQDQGAALAAAKRLLDLAGEHDIPLLIRAADMFLRLGEPDQVDECLARLDAVPGLRDSAQAAALTDALKGSRALLENEPWKAAALLRQAARQRPADANTAKALATAYLETGNRVAAAEVLEDILRRSPDNADVRWRLAEIAWQQGRMDRARELARTAPSPNNDDDTLSSLIRLACELRQGANPTSAPALSDENKAALTRLASSPPQRDAETRWLIRALAYAQLDDLALRLVQDRVEQPDPSPNIAVELGELFVARGRPDRALELGRTLQERFPDDPRPYLLRIKALAATGQLADATTLAREASLPDAASSPLFETLGDAYLAAGRTDAALDAFRDAADAAAKNTSARLKLARHTPQLDEALARIDEVRALEGEDGTRWKNARARALLRLAPDEDAANEAARLLEDCLAARPGWLEPRLLLAYAMELRGRPADAVSAYRAAIDREPVLIQEPVAIRLAELLERLARFEEAEGLVRQVNAHRQRGQRSSEPGQPNSPDPLPLEGDTVATDAPEARLWRLELKQSLRRQRYDLAAQKAEQLLSITPDDPALMATAADLYLRTGDPERAETHARRARSYDRAPPAALATLAAALFNQGRGDEAVTVVSQAAESNSDPRQWLLLARLRATRGEKSRAADALRRAEQLADGQAEIHLAAADTWAALGQRSEQLASIHRAIETRGGDPDESLALAQVLAASPDDTDRTRAREIVARRLSLNPDDVPAIVMAARLELASESPDLPKAEAQLERALALAPDNAQALGLTATVQMRAGRFQAALNSTEAGLAADPDNLDLRMTAARIHCHQGRFERALPVLTRIVRERPGFLDAAQLLAVAYRELGRPEEALARLAYLDGPGRKTAEGLQILAELFEANGDVHRAEQRLIEARRLDRDSTGTFQNLVRFYARCAEFDKVYQLAQERHAQYPADVQARMLAGYILAGNAPREDQRQTGSRWLEELAEQDPAHAPEALLRAGLALYQQHQLHQAEDKLAAALELQPMNREAVNALAWLYAVDLDRAPDARKLIDRFLADGGKEDPQLLDTHAKVLLKLGDYEAARRKLETCLEQVGYTSTRAAAHFHLGTAYQETGRTTEAVSYMREALRLAERLGGLTPEEKETAIRLTNPAHTDDP